MILLKRTFGLALIVLISPLFALLSQSESGSCKPAWVFLSKQPLKVDSGLYEVRFSAILVGCETHLEALKEGDLKEIQDVLKVILGKKALRLIGSAYSKELRIEAVTEINQHLKRRAVSDIFFTSLSVGEDI